MARTPAPRLVTGSPAAADVAALAGPLRGLPVRSFPMLAAAGERLGNGHPEQDVEPLAELLAEDLADWPDDAWLAFDDYQFASESSFAEEFVERVLHCPLEALFTSRKRPSWATSRRLLYGDIYEIGRSLLAMSQEEAEQVLAHRRGSEASGLVALADGWPAVIRPAALTDEIELPDEGVPEALYATSRRSSIRLRIPSCGEPQPAFALVGRGPGDGGSRARRARRRRVA